MDIFFVYFLAFLPVFLCMALHVAYSECKCKLSKGYSYIGDFSLSFDMLENCCGSLKDVHHVAKNNGIIGRDGLPREYRKDGNIHDWGTSFSVYTSLGGRQLHLRYGCCGAKSATHLYTMDPYKLSSKNFCVHCRKLLPENLIYFLRTKKDCEYYIQKMHVACSGLQELIRTYNKSLSKFLFFSTIKHFKIEYKIMLEKQKQIEKQLSVYLRKGYIGLEGAEFYLINYSKQSPVGTNPTPSFIAALTPVPQNATDSETSFRILRLGFPTGGFIVYEDDTIITPGREYKLFGKDKTEPHYVYLSKDSYNLLSPPQKLQKQAYRKEKRNERSHIRQIFL